MIFAKTNISIPFYVKDNLCGIRNGFGGFLTMFFAGLDAATVSDVRTFLFAFFYIVSNVLIMFRTFY